MPNKKTCLFLFLLVTLVSVNSVVNAQIPPSRKISLDTATEKVEEIERSSLSIRVDDFLTASGATGGILIAKNGKVILRKGYGWANETQRTPNTTKTVFGIGSVTKQFTSSAILKLEEQGKLKVTDSITKFFKDIPRDKQPITIHQLLTHTAGFEHDVVDRSEFPTRDENVRRILDSKLKLKPGEKYRYSNAGYALLSAIIEITSGLSYEGYLHKFLWKPVGMRKTGIMFPGYTSHELARSYDMLGDAGTLQERWWDKNGPSSGVLGAGSVLSTLEDLYLWHRALEGNKILSLKSKEKLFTSYVPEDAKGTSYSGYGWGIFRTPRGTRIIGHDGYNTLVFTNFQRFIDDDVVIIWFTNEPRTVSRQIFTAIEHIAFEKESPNLPRQKVKITRSQLQKCAGTYELASGDRFSVDLVGDNLQIRSAALGIGKLLTTFPKMEDRTRLENIESRVARIIEGISKESFEQIRAELYFDSTFENEKHYLSRTFAEWLKRFGMFRKSEVIGSGLEKELLVTYVILQFENGTTIVQFRQNSKREFSIATSNMLIPRYYRLIPQTIKEMVVYNHVFQTTKIVSFHFGKKDDVTGLSFEDEKVFAKKIMP